MNWHVSIVTPPAIEPITLDQALEHCHANSGIEDDWFRDAITAARQEAEIYQRRAYIEQTIQLSFDTWPELPIYLPRAPAIEVSSVKLYDLEDTETSITTTNFLIDYSTSPARLTTIHGYEWPGVSLRDINSIQIQYTAGYGTAATDVPPKIRNAILFYIGYMYENRAAEIERVPPQFYHMLAPQRMYL